AVRRKLAGWLASPDPSGRLNDGLGLDAEHSRYALFAGLETSPALPVSLWGETALVLAAGSKSVQSLAVDLQAAFAARGDARVAAYLDVFLTKTNRTVRSRLLTKDFRERHPDWADRLDGEAQRAARLHGRLNALTLAERSQALFTLAGGIIAVFEREKQRRGLMEFQDLIDHAAALLAPEGNRWVLYKLDGGLDHVLLDEAQDTSPEQWTIIKHLTEEFFGAEAEASAAAGGQGRKRTLFAVGDEKQSIFSFQGAQPATFETERERISEAAEATRHRFETVPIETSFRSAPNILAAVDAVFASDEMHADLTAKGAPPHHESARPNAPSFVELWAPELPRERPEERAWDAPLDQPDANEPSDVMARRIADQIAALIAGGMPPGEILVLVRGRNRAFEAVIRALRAADVPVAGADRLKLLEQIAILDCLALADVLLLPDDDLALATVLKSPLIDFADAAMDAETRLFHLAHGRDGRLWNALAERAKTDPVCERALERLDGWLRRAPYARPFEFFSEVLGAGGGRRAFLARLGSEAGDALDEFLSLALDFEERATPTLQAFVHDLRQTEREVKRELSEAGETVRVMTVHNAKGLEAQAVFLVCSGQKIMDGAKDPDIFALGDGPGAPLVYAPSAQQDPEEVSAIRLAHRRARAAEERRLL
ncbi:MAG: UvrD-helicase domain-containing protein, partial [Pseudomonadota bacterium]